MVKYISHVWYCNLNADFSSQGDTIWIIIMHFMCRIVDLIVIHIYLLPAINVRYNLTLRISGNDLCLHLSNKLEGNANIKASNSAGYFLCFLASNAPINEYTLQITMCYRISCKGENQHFRSISFLNI